MMAVMIGLTGVLPVFISNTKPSQLGVYPNYILVYLHHLVVPQCVKILVMLLAYYKIEQLRDWYEKEFKSLTDYVQKLYLSRNNWAFS